MYNHMTKTWLFKNNHNKRMTYTSNTDIYMYSFFLSYFKAIKLSYT